MVRFFIISILILQTVTAVFAESSEMILTADGIKLEERSVFEHGRALYDKFCAQCHGLQGSPSTDMIDLFDPPIIGLAGSATGPAIYKYGSSIEAITESIRNGRGSAMLSFRGRLSDSQIRAVARYVESLSKQRP
jgi:mono/diheme cytochrome c family protein